MARTKPKKAKSKLTPKDVGLVDGVKLSETYANTKTHFKTVSDGILGYAIFGSLKASARVAPIYRADVWFREGKNSAIISSYEMGEYYNDLNTPTEPDFEGNSLANAAMAIITALQNHAVNRGSLRTYVKNLEKEVVRLTAQNKKLTDNRKPSKRSPKP